MLNKRLEAIISMIASNSIVSDVGCDHALLVCELVKRKIINKAYAMDVNEKPLNQARKSIKEYNLETNIDVLLSNGLARLPKDADTLVIAGMGYETCKIILENDLNKLQQFNTIIIQVNRDVTKLRQWISDHNFTIQNEKIILDRHYYQIIAFNTKYHDQYTIKEIEFGPILINQKNNTFIEYYKKQLTKLETTLFKVTTINKKESIIDSISKINNILK